jgi:hypothetical protein
MQLSERLRIDTSWAGGAPGGLVVAVLGACTQRDSAALRQLRHSADHALAVQLDVAASGTDGLRTPWLVAQGWRAGTLGRADSVQETWRGLGVTRAAVGR